jgi:hypothetical protein
MPKQLILCETLLNSRGMLGRRFHDENRLFQEGAKR